MVKTCFCFALPLSLSLSLGACVCVSARVFHGTPSFPFIVQFICSVIRVFLLLFNLSVRLSIEFLRKGKQEPHILCNPKTGSPLNRDCTGSQ